MQTGRGTGGCREFHPDLIDPVCLLLQQPNCFLIGETYPAAFRPVHLRNIGQPGNLPLDNYWKRIFELTFGLLSAYTIYSFADDQELLPYFNTHCFSLNPQAQICSSGWQLMTEIAQNIAFLEQSCSKKPDSFSFRRY